MFEKMKGKAMLAPMAGVSDIAFRTLCKQYGSAASITEFISIEALTRNNKKTLEMLKKDETESPFVIQLFGTDIKRMQQAVKLVENKCDWIDLNLGCPATKIIDQGAGSALLQYPEKVRALIKTMVSATNKPITCKIRIGYKKNNAVEIAKICEQEGAKLITVHGRTRIQRYSGKADWEVIKQVVQAVNIPVIGNGDITSPEIAKERLQQSGCHALQIGRAAMGNPYIFKQIQDYNKKGTYDQPNKRTLFKEYLELVKKHAISFQQIKMQAMWFSKGREGGPKIRKQISQTKELEEITRIFK